MSSSNHNQHTSGDQSVGYSAEFCIGTVHIGASETAVGVANEKGDAFTTTPFPSSRWSEAPASLKQLLHRAHLQISKINLLVARDHPLSRTWIGLHLSVNWF